MPEDLKRAIVEAIAASGDENYKRLLMLLLRVEEVYLDRLEELKDKLTELSDQMTVPPESHAEDHRWITATRKAEGGIKAAGLKIAVSLLEKGALVAAGAAASKLIGG